MNEYLSNSSIETLKFGQYDIDIIENPQKSLTEEQKDEMASNARHVLEVTTGIKDRKISDVKRSLFGQLDRGRVLFVFRENEEVVGFTSWHLLNKDNELITFNGSTILHAGSGHILPSEQGNRLWLVSSQKYLNSLPEELRPRYVEGFTQSPRMFKLATLLSKNEIYPNLRERDSLEDLVDLQKTILPKIVSEMTGVYIQNQFIVKGMGERVYNEAKHADEKTDQFFYNRLGVNTAEGDFLHFVAKIPTEIYEK